MKSKTLLLAISGTVGAVAIVVCQDNFAWWSAEGQRCGGAEGKSSPLLPCSPAPLLASTRQFGVDRVIGYFGSQLLNPTTMILIGTAGVIAGAVMFCIQQLQQRQQLPQTKAQPKPVRNRSQQTNEPRTATRVD